MMYTRSRLEGALKALRPGKRSLASPEALNSGIRIFYFWLPYFNFKLK